jgi:hypothetical protein
MDDTICLLRRVASKHRSKRLPSPLQFREEWKGYAAEAMTAQLEFRPGVLEIRSLQGRLKRFGIGKIDAVLGETHLSPMLFVDTSWFQGKNHDVLIERNSPRCVK